jgi:alpha-ribazole phosphatase
VDVVLVRHGKTVLNVQGRYCGAIDAELSPEGSEKIKRLKAYYKSLKFDCIYVSPFKRAIQTAEILGFNYEIDERLREMNFGRFEGLTYGEINEKYPEECKRWNEDFLHYKIPEGESLKDVFERTEDFLNEVSKKHKRVLAVTHGGIIRCALSLVFNSFEYFYKFRVENGAAVVISIDGGYSYIKGINLGKELMEVLT